MLSGLGCFYRTGCSGRQTRPSPDDAQTDTEVTCGRLIRIGMRHGQLGDGPAAQRQPESSVSIADDGDGRRY